ncbi:MAG TPA: tetrahydrofolate dehydrogenase/cyclohydrolase catalytic domain-containing protein, partial [Capillimicrobium sp.]
MAAKLIDGKAVAARLREQVAQDAAGFEREFGRRPGLATILVGEDPASHVYVANKHKASEAAGIVS